MSTVACLQCEAYIEVTNIGFAGYCSPDCRDADRHHRQDAQDRRRQARRLSRDKVGDEQGWRGR